MSHLRSVRFNVIPQCLQRLKMIHTCQRYQLVVECKPTVKCPLNHQSVIHIDTSSHDGPPFTVFSWRDWVQCMWQPDMETPQASKGWRRGWEVHTINTSIKRVTEQGEWLHSTAVLLAFSSNISNLHSYANRSTVNEHIACFRDTYQSVCKHIHMYTYLLHLIALLLTDTVQLENTHRPEYCLRLPAFGSYEPIPSAKQSLRGHQSFCIIGWLNTKSEWFLTNNHQQSSPSSVSKMQH